MNFPGSGGGLSGGGMPAMTGLIPQAGSQGMSAQEMQQVAMMKGLMESCPAKSVMAGVMGGGMGALFGLFMSSMRYDTPMSTLPGQPSTAITDLPMREQLRLGLKDMGRSSLSSAKNFGYLGLCFAGIECCIEGLRGKNDIYNGVAGGFITGGFLARKQGIGAMAFGALGFGAFSWGIEWYMRKPDNERRFPVE